jgi:hypothetical protein
MHGRRDCKDGRIVFNRRQKNENKKRGNKKLNDLLQQTADELKKRILKASINFVKNCSEKDFAKFAKRF